MFQINPWLIAIVVIVVVAIFTFIINRVVRVHRRQPSAGREDMIGKVAEVKVALQPKGMVLIQGEQWTAVSESGRVEPGEEVIINRVDSLKLYVTKKQ